MWRGWINQLHSAGIVLETARRRCVATVWVTGGRRDGGEGFGELFFKGFGFGVEGGAGLCIACSSQLRQFCAKDDWK